MKKLILLCSILLVIGLGVGLSADVSAEKGVIPTWIKSTAEFWVEEQVSDAEFLNAIQYLLDNKILRTENELDDSSEKRLTDLEIENSELKNRIFDLEYRHSNNIVTYSIDTIPEYADGTIVNDAVREAFHNWERTNSEIDFLKVEKEGDIVIKFWKIPKQINPVFGALGEVDVLGCFDDCVITLALGDQDCTGKWSQFTTKSTQEVMMHEIGHILGVEHTSRYPHMMYSPRAEFESSELGYLIPKNVEEIPHIINHASLYADIETHKKKIDEILKPWGLTLDEFYSGEKQPNSKKFYMEADQIVNPLIEEWVELESEIGCFTVHNQGFD